MDLLKLTNYIKETNGSRDAEEYVLEWIEINSTDSVTRDLVTLLFESRE